MKYSIYLFFLLNLDRKKTQKYFTFRSYFTAIYDFDMSFLNLKYFH